ncbi:helix-turn-helix domain-containing protein [Candidatus Bipolaricaulota bacterium]|nr:helix-turn-helix domain-containing protein [Candidatus Bipolaricaulota bacterium]
MTANEHTKSQIKITWDSGTGYDFFTSLAVLKDPKKFGIRSAWASGMRARLQPEDRESLDTLLVVAGIPAPWIHSLPEPKDVDHCLGALAQIPASDRLAILANCPACEDEQTAKQQLLLSVAQRGSWTNDELESLRSEYTAKAKLNHPAPDREELKLLLNTWAQAEAFGERVFVALSNYQSVFFKEEEQRIAPKLAHMLTVMQERAEALPTVEFLEEVSHGIRYDDLPMLAELALVPSYWISPFIQIHDLGENRRMWTFGARPVGDSLVPGEPVPDLLRVSLKALADPTRLRILRYIYQQPLTLAELTKRLRLRMPTVIHHLSALRLAGLVSIHVGTRDKGGRQKYGVRSEGLDATLEVLKGFIESDQSLAISETQEEEYHA